MAGSRATACDQCRRRKIRCDTNTPCSHCSRSGRPCTNTGPGQKLKEPRRRVLITKQHEQKIDFIINRLSAIETLLADTRPVNPAQHGCSCHTSPPAITLDSNLSHSRAKDTSSTVFEHDDSASAVEGSSSLTAQTAKAVMFAKSSGPSDMQFADAIDSLNWVLKPQTTRDGPTKRAPCQPSGYRDMPIPPISAVVEILGKLKENPPPAFSVIRSFMPVEAFIDLCRKVYFCTDKYSDSAFIIVSSGLYCLFREYFNEPEDGSLQGQYWEYSCLCRDALAAALTTVGAVLPACMESVQALLLGASHAIELSKAWLAWRLVCFAAQLCFTLGYHDNALGNADDVETRSTKSLVFWHIYSIEKGLSLRLGKSSIIRDEDITLPSNFGNLLLPNPWSRVLSFWVGNARVQGKVYELLYSPAAQSSSKAEVLRHAEHLLAELESVKQRVQPIFNLGTPLPQLKSIEDILSVSHRVTYYTTATIICRAQVFSDPDAPFWPSLMHNARAAMASHEECMRMTETNAYFRSIYIHWTVLYSPFVPLIVMLCSVMRTTDLVDLRRLEQFTTSLEPSAALSPSADKLYRLSQSIYGVANQYVNAKQNCLDSTTAPSSGFNYLGALGWLPNGSGYMTPVDNSKATTLPQLEQWGLGTQLSTGFLGDDFFQFNMSSAM